MTQAPPYKPRKKPLYRVLAQHVAWNPPEGTEFVLQRQREIKRCLDLLPSGSGWDMGTKLMDSASDENKLTLYGEFHHMDEWGGYDGWTDHTIVVRADLRFGFKLHITGRNRNDIKDYLHEMFDVALRAEVYEYERHEEEALRAPLASAQAEREEEAQ